MQNTDDHSTMTLFDLLRDGGRMVVDYRGVKIPVDYQKGSSDKALFLFHGAAKRSLREIPFFQPFLPNYTGAHQFSISDPTMLTTSIIEAGWYSGAQGEEMQSVLRDFLRDIREALQSTRRVYVGASSGGFAALLYSHSDPGSIAVAAIPQTVLRNHYAIPVNRYRHECWPDCATIPDLDGKGVFDLSVLYAQDFENTVVYVQSAGDRFHMANHMVPFLTAFDEADQERLVCDVGFWGKLGHSGATPPTAFLPWVEAALSAPTPNADTLLETRFSLLKEDHKIQILEQAKKMSGAHAASVANEQDIRLNGLIRDYLLAGTS